MSLIIYGPADYGITPHLETLRKHFGLVKVIYDTRDPYPLADEWGEFMRGKTLFVTHKRPPSNDYNINAQCVMSFEQTMMISRSQHEH